MSPSASSRRDNKSKRRSRIDAERTGRDLAHLDYYVGFNQWKYAAITHGVYARYREGKKGTEGILVDEFRASILHSLTLAEHAVERLAG